MFPLHFVDTLGRFDVEATVEGGGHSSQAGALRLAISRALLSFVSNGDVENMRQGECETHTAQTHTAHFSLFTVSASETCMCGIFSTLFWPSASGSWWMNMNCFFYINTVKFPLFIGLIVYWQNIWDSIAGVWSLSFIIVLFDVSKLLMDKPSLKHAPGFRSWFVMWDAASDSKRQILRKR